MIYIQFSELTSHSPYPLPITYFQLPDLIDSQLVTQASLTLIMSSSKGPSDEAGRVEEAVQSLLSRMNKLQKWAELQMQIDKSISRTSYPCQLNDATTRRRLS